MSNGAPMTATANRTAPAGVTVTEPTIAWAMTAVAMANR